MKRIQLKMLFDNSQINPLVQQIARASAPSPALRYCHRLKIFITVPWGGEGQWVRTEGREKRRENVPHWRAGGCTPPGHAPPPPSQRRTVDRLLYNPIELIRLAFCLRRRNWNLFLPNRFAELSSAKSRVISGHDEVTFVKMDYSYLNQAAASFDASSCSLTPGIDPGLGPCSYGDLTSCSQMSYRYTAAAASMARSYNPGGAGMGHHLTGAGAQCSVMGGPRHQDHRPPMFPTAMNLQAI
ncbi:hypothetical protein J6590_076832 [Homalodisca vitripennis]|nr:hypothetical protein J6590_076832 [Homalodisca vitripennis]